MASSRPKDLAAAAVLKVEEERSEEFAASVVDDVLDKTKAVLGDDIPPEVMEKLKFLWLGKINNVKAEKPDLDMREVRY